MTLKLYTILTRMDLAAISTSKWKKNWFERIYIKWQQFKHSIKL